MKRICLIGLGEVGRVLAEDLLARGDVALSAWDPRFTQPGSPPARAVAELDVRAGRDAADAARGAELIVSAVTAAQTVAAARAVGAAIAESAVFLDLNSASPAAKVAAAQKVQAGGGLFVEGAVMSPIAPRRIASPILLGGPHARAFEAGAQALGFAGARFYAEEPGKAAAAKLCRSVIVKGMEALLGESLLAARSYGVEADVIASLDDLFPGPDWRRLSRYMISRSIEHGVRRAEEMAEAARTVSQAGIEPLMSLATVDRQRWASGFQEQLACEDLQPFLSGMLEQARR